MAPPPPAPPGSPPKPPPRRAPERADDAAAAPNPFIAADPLLGNLEVPLAPSANPFLAQSPQPAPHSAPEPQAARTPEGVERGTQRSAAVPQVRDPHAEFRKGSWKKPAAFLAVAALLAGGLFFGLPDRTEEKKDAIVASPEAVTVIGRSVAPEIIQDPDQPSLSQPNPPPARAKVPEEPGESPDRPDQSGSFASMFKSSGQ